MNIRRILQYVVFIAVVTVVCFVGTIIGLLIWLGMHRASTGFSLPFSAAVGDVGPNYIKVWIRAVPPSPSSSISHSVLLRYRATDDSGWHTWTAGCTTSQEHYWTGTTTITNLLPNKRYVVVVEDRSQNKHMTLTFRTAPPSTLLSSFRFVFGSCMAPFPIIGMPPLSYIAALNPLFALFIGDTIYSDLPNVIQSTHYLYNDVINQKQWVTAATTVPMLFQFDDHEIRNNWGSSENDNVTDEFFKSQMNVYQSYVGSRNPSSYATCDILGHVPFYYHFRRGAVCWFVVDVRTYRSPISMVDDGSKTMLGVEQLSRLKSWLFSEECDFKFITSPAIFSIPESDGWRKYYAREQQELINFLSDNDISNVAILSGDVHWAGVFKTKLPNNKYLWEFSVSPIHAFPLPCLPCRFHSDVDTTLVYYDDLFMHFGSIDVHNETQSSVDVSDVSLGGVDDALLPHWGHAQSSVIQHVDDVDDPSHRYFVFRLYRYHTIFSPEPKLVFQQKISF